MYESSILIKKDIVVLHPKRSLQCQERLGSRPTASDMSRIVLMWRNSFIPHNLSEPVAKFVYHNEHPYEMFHKVDNKSITD